MESKRPEMVASFACLIVIVFALVLRRRFGRSTALVA
jgi:hypothetical protein